MSNSMEILISCHPKLSNDSHDILHMVRKWCYSENGKRKYVSANLVKIGPHNALVSGRRHTIVWTSDGLSALEPSGVKCNEVLIKYIGFISIKRHMASIYFVLALIGNTRAPSSKHIEAKTEWPPFCRRHFKTYCLNDKCCILIQISLIFSSLRSN